MKTVNSMYLKRTIEHLKELAVEYKAEAEKWEELDHANLSGWYEGRGAAFACVAEWIEMDIDTFGEEV